MGQFCFAIRNEYLHSYIRNHSIFRSEQLSRLKHKFATILLCYSYALKTCDDVFSLYFLSYPMLFSANKEKHPISLLLDFFISTQLRFSAIFFLGAQSKLRLMVGKGELS